MSDAPREKPSTTTLTSTFLLEGLRKPDNHTVWQQFVERYRPLIVRYARRFGLRDEEAQDAAQQALIAFSTAYQDGKYDRDRGRLRVWLFGIARNQILNMKRKRRDREVQMAGQASKTDFFAQVGDEDQLEKMWEEEWRDSVLRQCLEEVRKEVDARTVEAFELFAWKGWSAQKVAEHLGMTENAVFLVKHRVMKRIKKILPQIEADW